MRVFRKKSSLNLTIFCTFDEKFQLSFNSIEFSVKLSFSRILGLNFHLLFNFVKFQNGWLSVDLSEFFGKFLASLNTYQLFKK